MIDSTLAANPVYVANDGQNMGFGGGLIWIIFLFFILMSGGFGGYGANAGSLRLDDEFIKRDLFNINQNVSTQGCETRSAVQESAYQTLLGFKDMQMQQAQCCCDLKSAIHAEGEETRALITSNTIQELRDNLQAAQLQLGNLSQTQTLINALRPFPTPAYITCSPYTAFNGFGCGSCGYGC